MEGHHMRHVLADCLPEPVLHLIGGLAIEREKHQLARVDSAVALEEDRARHEGAGLPAPRPGHDLDVPTGRRDRSGLVEVERFLQFRLHPLLDETRADVPSLRIVSAARNQGRFGCTMIRVQEVGTCRISAKRRATRCRRAAWASLAARRVAASRSCSSSRSRKLPRRSLPAPARVAPRVAVARVRGVGSTRLVRGGRGVSATAARSSGTSHSKFVERAISGACFA